MSGLGHLAPYGSPGTGRGSATFDATFGLSSGSLSGWGVTMRFKRRAEIYYAFSLLGPSLIGQNKHHAKLNLYGVLIMR